MTPKEKFPLFSNTFFSFGMCDTYLPDTEVIHHPTVKKLNLMTPKDKNRFLERAGWRLFEPLERYSYKLMRRYRQEHIVTKKEEKG